MLYIAIQNCVDLAQQLIVCPVFKSFCLLDKVGILSLVTVHNAFYSGISLITKRYHSVAALHDAFQELRLQQKLQLHLLCSAS